MASVSVNPVPPQQHAARQAALLALTNNPRVIGYLQKMENIAHSGVIILDSSASFPEASPPPVTEPPLSARALRKQKAKVERLNKQRARTRIESKPQHSQGKNFSRRSASRR